MVVLLLAVQGATCGGPEGVAEAPPARVTARPASPPPPSSPEPEAPEPAMPAPPPSADAGSAPGRVFAESLEVVGPLPTVVVHRVLRRYAAQVQHCYEQQLVHEPGLQGRVVLSFTISPTGTVSEAAIASSTLGSRPVEECITRQARRWLFPTPQGGGTVTVSYPVALSTPTPAPSAPPGTVAWTLVVAPARVTMARRAQVSVQITATNRGARTVDPGRSLEFTVDGTPSMELGMAFGNGGMEASWTALPAGATVRDERIGMELVTAPGEHVIVMSQGGAELARAVLHVTR